LAIFFLGEPCTFAASPQWLPNSPILDYQLLIR
jgi:hypothetical protein